MWLAGYGQLQGVRPCVNVLIEGDGLFLQSPEEESFFGCQSRMDSREMVFAKRSSSQITDLRPVTGGESGQKMGSVYGLQVPLWQDPVIAISGTRWAF
jgi:hypothetical protein